ncbi:MAG: glycine cleavage system aminomethyltransferase GcvT [Chloroflexota bacterium]|jgi:glycine hydroxymethyltransferase
MSSDFISQGTLDEIDPQLSKIIAGEDSRQQRKVILIASESVAAPAVRQLMSSNFGNVYAEGYPRSASRQQTEDEIADIDLELAHYRRYSDPRYYKGVEYADILEALARRRAANLFAANGVSPDDMYVNVQPLSGSPANAAVYGALMDPGHTLMGLDLIHGGHLTHGSKVSRSGKLYHSVPYKVDLETEQLDYDAIEALALEARPEVIVCGFTAYPLMVDWQRFRQIADNCGAYLVADIAHISGLVAAGVHPSPIGIADVVTTTTHKSLCGPRGAMIMTHRADLARKLDRSVFPGEQGGPHLNNIAALALALKLAKNDDFRALQQRVVRNASRLAQRLAENQIRVVAGGTENHLILIDTKSVKHNGQHLTGDMAARILDVAGFVTNSNTIPGDSGPFSATGVRMGTVWISQLGYGDAEVDLLAEGLTSVLKGCKPFSYPGLSDRWLARAKVSKAALEAGRATVAQLTGRPNGAAESDVIEVRGNEARAFLNEALASDILALAVGQAGTGELYADDWQATCTVLHVDPDRYLLRFADDDSAARASLWLQDLSDAYVQFDDIYAKLSGPISAKLYSGAESVPALDQNEGLVAFNKPYFIGWQKHAENGNALPSFEWIEDESASLKRTKLHEIHSRMGGRMVPFGGWDMPVWYSSVSEEHAAVRQAAGLFDVSHMGVLEVSGPNAVSFLNVVTTNDVTALKTGQSHYSYLLFPDGSVIDDLLIYQRGPEKFMLVVNASNNDKDWTWINAVNQGLVRIDSRRPAAKILHPAVIRDLRDPANADDCLVDIALQGPASTKILLDMCHDSELARRIKGLRWAELTEGKLGSYQVVISRTGYTGERVAYELFVHPDSSPAFWNKLLEIGQKHGLKPCGLAARDSTRTEAGLPLYGHELAGPLAVTPAEAGFASYLKLWKPFFVGREASIDNLENRERRIIRFRFDERGVRRAELGDPVLDKRGKVVGTVTSCAIDHEGYLLGQAIVQESLASPGTGLAIYQLGGGQRKLRLPDAIEIGSRLPMADRATVLTRFPKR